jgi:hypothetical protein
MYPLTQLIPNTVDFFSLPVEDLAGVLLVYLTRLGGCWQQCDRATRESEPVGVFQLALEESAVPRLIGNEVYPIFLSGKYDTAIFEAFRAAWGSRGRPRLQHARRPMRLREFACPARDSGLARWHELHHALET